MALASCCVVGYNGQAMRIAMIGLFGLKPKGTMSVRALPLARALVAKGHQVSIILPPWSYPQDSGREWEEDGVSICNITLPPRFPLLRQAQDAIWHVMVTWRLVQQALLLRPDVIHCFKPKGYAGLAALAVWLLKKLGLSKARLVVDSDDWEGKGGWNEIEPYTWLQRRFFAWQERWGLTHCDALTVASRALATIAWSLGVEPGRVFYVPNGVVSGFESNTQYPISNIQFTDRPTVLLYTRFFEFQVERAVGIFRRVQAEVPEARLLVVGKGFFGEEERLLELMQAVGLADHLVYVDWVEPDELPAYFAAADVAIYPYDDTLINRAKCAVKLIDLLAAGVPVVADDVGQNREYVVHGVSGLLIPAGETDTFAGSVVELLRDESLRAKLGGGAQRRIFEEFNWGKLVARVEEAYQGADDK